MWVVKLSGIQKVNSSSLTEFFSISIKNKYNFKILSLCEYNFLSQLHFIVLFGQTRGLKQKELYKEILY